MEISFSPKFEREYKKLSREIRWSAEEAEEIFRKDIFDPRLETHKLHGRQKEYWSFSVTKKIRIIFEITGNNTFRFHRIGDHDIYE